MASRADPEQMLRFTKTSAAENLIILKKMSQLVRF